MYERENRLEDRMAAAFEPDTLLASQYFDRVRRRAAHDGERRLMVAVLEDAVHVYVTHAGARDAARRELFVGAEEWIESRDATWLYSFENVCSVLDLDADYLRRGLRSRKERAVGGERGTAPDATETAHLRRASGE
jgi:hypothetical protein